MSSFLITGGAGFIGSHFVDLALKKGHRLVVLDALTYAGHLENLEQAKGDWEFIEGDITDAALVTRLLRDFDIDAVFNFAAESHVDRSISGASPFIETNILGTFTLLEETMKYFKSLSETRRKGFRYLQVSTDEVFGDLGPEGHFTETSPFKPHSPYSASKASADHLVHAWHHTYGLPTLTTHCSNNYGPRQYPEKLIPFMIRCALDNKPLGVYGNGANVRDWIYVVDHCEGIYLAWENGKIGERYCFGGASERSNISVVQTIAASLDEFRPRTDGHSYSEQISFVKDRLGHDRRYAIDDRLAHDKLGFRRSTNFEDGLKSTIKWYLDNASWMTAVLEKDT